MSQRDDGYGREPAEHHEAEYHQAQYPRQPQYPCQDEQAAHYPYRAASPRPRYDDPEAFSRPQYEYPEPAQFPRYPPAQLPQPPAVWLPHDPYAQPPTPYAMQPGQQPGATYPPDSASWSDEPEWPDGGGYPERGAPYDPPTAYPITDERDGFEGRAPLPAMPPPTAAPHYGTWPDAAGPAYHFAVEPPPPDPVPPYPPWPPWPDAADPNDAFGAGPSRDRWRPPPPPDDPAYPGYPGLGRSGYPRGRTGGGWRPGDGPAPVGDGPWPEGAEPWPPDDAEWFDARPDRGRWLIPAAVAVAGAVVGVAIVMVALGHSRAPAASHPGTPAPTVSTGPARVSTSTAAAGGAAAAAPGRDSAPIATAVQTGAHARFLLLSAMLAGAAVSARQTDRQPRTNVAQ